MKNQNFVLCQCENTATASYETFACNTLHAFGFVCINVAQGFVSHESFDSVKDYCDMLGCDVEKYACLQALAVGERVVVDECEFVCMWTKKNK